MTKLVKFVRRVDAARLAVYLIALWKLFRHPATPLPAKLIAIATLAYAVSPIDLIPDFIPVIGQLDDLVIVPMGVALAVRLTPAAHWQARLREAETTREKLPSLRWLAAAGALLLAGLIGLMVWGLVRVVGGA